MLLEQLHTDDVIVVTKYDRLARSLKDLIDYQSEIHSTRRRVQQFESALKSYMPRIVIATRGSLPEIQPGYSNSKSRLGYMLGGERQSHTGVIAGGAHCCSMISVPGIYVRMTNTNVPFLVLGSQLDSLSIPGDAL